MTYPDTMYNIYSSTRTCRYPTNVQKPRNNHIFVHALLETSCSKQGTLVTLKIGYLISRKKKIYVDDIPWYYNIHSSTRTCRYPTNV